MSEGKTTTAKSTLFQSLMKRRVPQISGFYLGASWGLIQFVEWIVVRYGLSPYLPDFSLVILFSLFPSVFMVAYFHGRPGEDEWQRIEKVTIPINLIFTISLLVIFFSGKELGAATKTIVVQNEVGKTVKKVVAKSEFRKKVALFNVKNTTGDETLNWLESGFPMLMQLDMMQDPFIDEVSLLLDNGNILQNLKKAGFETGVDAPISLLSKVAIERHYEYFVTGNFSKKGDEYLLSIKLYDAERGKRLASNEIVSEQLLELVDQASILTKENLGIPKYHLESLQDFPVAEVSSGNLEALKLLVNALEQLQFHNNYLKGAEFSQAAIEKDTSFALAYFYLGILQANLNQSKQSVKSLRLAMKYDFKLPEFLKFLVKDTLYLMSGESKKRLSLLKMQTSLEPENIDIRLRLSYLYSANKKYAEAIKEIKSVMEISPQPETYLDNIGYLYLQMNQFDQAEVYFKDYLKAFPSESTSFNNLAYLYNLQGKDELVRENYEKSLLLDPENLPATLNLASVDEKFGDLEKAFKQYQTALTSFNEPAEKAQIFNRLVNFYTITGQPKKALEMVKSSLLEQKKFSPPLNVLISELMTVTTYIRAGEKQQAFEILKNVEKQLQPPFDTLSSLGYSLAYAELKQSKLALEQIKIFEKALAELEGTLQGMSFYPFKLRAKISESNGDYPQALIEYKTYAENSPLDGSRFFDIGRIYRKLNDFENAQEFLTKQYEITPYYPKVNYQLGLLYVAMDEKEKALKHFQLAAEVWKNSEPGYDDAIKNQLELNKLLEKES